MTTNQAEQILAKLPIQYVIFIQHRIHLMPYLENRDLLLKVERIAFSVLSIDEFLQFLDENRQVAAVCCTKVLAAKDVEFILPDKSMILFREKEFGLDRSERLYEVIISHYSS